MSGHSKWKTNKGKKMVADAKKGATYTKILRSLRLSPAKAAVILILIPGCARLCQGKRSKYAFG